MERKATMNFTTEAEAGAQLPVDDSFVFDGRTSDIARQLYLRHVAGDSIAQFEPNLLPSAVKARLEVLNVSFEKLPGLLQRALLWDAGFVLSPENDAVQIWTLGGRSMADIAISQMEYHTTGCTTFNCSQPNDRVYSANKNCTGTQMLSAAKCLMDNFDSDTSYHVAMWSNGGDARMLPEIRAVKHGWLEAATNASYLVYAVHTMKLDAEPAYGTCTPNGYGSFVVPCYPKRTTSTDVVALMSPPVSTPWVTTWLKQYQSTSDTLNSSERDDSGFHLWLLGPILLVSFVLFPLLFFAVYKKRQRLDSVYVPRPSPVERDGRRKAKPPGPLLAHRHSEVAPSLRRTEQETIGELGCTLPLPCPDDSLDEDPSPLLEEILPHSRRDTAPALPTPRLAARTSHVAAQFSSVPLAHTLAARDASAPRRKVGQRPSSGRPSSAQLPDHPSSVRGLRIPRLALARRSYSDLWSDKASVQSHLGDPYLPTLQEAISKSPTLDSTPSIRDLMQADWDYVPALRETFCRSSAVDNVQYELLTDAYLVGKRIAWDRIELGPLLSRGAFGEVWACRYAGKKVAVKRLLQTKKHTFQETKAFMHEIKLTASLNHPNVVCFIGVTWSSLENLAMVEEFLPRGDLQQYLKRTGDLMTWARDKIDLAIGIVKAIHYLHSRHVIHRDVKARNILLTKRLQPKLVDFGTSRVWDLNNMTAGIGTPFWTAPEVLESSEYTEKADIYSFGVLLTELDTCEAPYSNTLKTNGEKMKPFHVLKEVLDGTLRPSLTVECPQRIRQAVEDCFQHDPKLRPSAAELVRMLEG